MPDSAIGAPRAGRRPAAPALRSPGRRGMRGMLHVRHAEWVIAHEFAERLRLLPTTESGTPVSWTPATASDLGGTLNSLTAFSWCFRLGLRMESTVSALPASVSWLGDALFGQPADSEDGIEVLVRGQSGYALSTSRPADESSGGASAWSGFASVMRDPTGAKGQWATADFWFWPLPPSGTVEVSLVWPPAHLNAVIATFSGDELRAAPGR